MTLFDAGQIPEVLTSYRGQLLLTGQVSLDLPKIWLTQDDNLDGFLLPSLDLTAWTALEALDLATFLAKAVQKLEKDWLAHLPLHTAIFDADNQLIYHNHKPKDAFLFDQIDKEALADWQFKEFISNPNHVSHLLLPSISFDQILIESSQGLYQNGQFQGIYQHVWDIKPLLASYLKETGQAIVGWSDVTSGASIKNSLFDDEEF